MATNQFEYADINQFKKQDFESFCQNILSKFCGMVVKQTKASKDGGKDLVMMDRDGRIVFVECKTESKPIGEPKITAFNDTCNEAGVRGMYASTSSFTRDAILAAKKRGILLIDYGVLCRMGDRCKPRVYHFGSEPPRMISNKEVGTITLSRGRAVGANFRIYVDGFEEPVEFKPKQSLVLTMHEGKHKIRIEYARKTENLDVNLKGDIVLAIRQQLTLTGGFAFQFEND